MSLPRVTPTSTTSAGGPSEAAATAIGRALADSSNAFDARHAGGPIFNPTRSAEEQHPLVLFAGDCDSATPVWPVSSLFWSVYECVRGSATALLELRTCPAAHSVRIVLPDVESDVNSFANTVVGSSSRRRRDTSERPLDSVETCLIAVFNILLVAVPVLSFLYERKRLPDLCHCSQKLFVVPFPLRRCRAACTPVVRACERAASHRALLVWFGRRAFFLHARAVGAVGNSCQRRSSCF